MSESITCRKPTLKVKFTDFWTDFNYVNFIFFTQLNEKFNVIISDEPDILFYSVYGNEHITYQCTKVFYTAENIRPDFLACDYAFTFDYHSSKKNFRLPLYFLYDDVTKLLNKNLSRETLRKKTKFCCFIVSNSSCAVRNQFFNNLSKHKHVDSGGSLFNNIGKLVESKREFIKEYKFVIAFENSSYPGYVTEKIFEPLLEDSIPIYWGNPLIEKDFNTRRFINCHDYGTFNDVIEEVLRIDEDDEKYLQYLTAPAFTNDELNQYVKIENIVLRLDQIIIYNSERSPFLKAYQFARPLYCFIKCQIKKFKNRLHINPL